MASPEERKARRIRRGRMRRPARAKQRFCEHLAATYDADGACAAAGLCWIDMCTLRDEDPVFAAAWERIRAAGYERIEIMLLQLGGAAGPATGMKPDLAVARELAKQRGARRRQPAGGAGTPKPNKEREIAAIMRRLGAIRAARGVNEWKDDGHETDAALARMADAAHVADRGGGDGRSRAAPGPPG